MRPKKYPSLIIAILFLFSCANSKEQAGQGNDAEGTDDGSKPSVQEEGSQGKVTNAELKDHTHLDGCHFMLITPDDEKLYPLNLDTAYHQDGLKVRVRYRKKDAMTTCMAGTNVKILEIERLD